MSSLSNRLLLTVRAQQKRIEELELSLEDAKLCEVNAFQNGWAMYADSGCMDRLPDEMADAWKHLIDKAALKEQNDD